MVEPQEVARSFVTEFGRIEHAMKRAGLLKPGREAAEADWNAFARLLGAEFFASVVEREIAPTLIHEPPRRLLSTMVWSPKKPVPLTDVHQLIVQGVCRTRNSYIHGEKFTGGPEERRDRDLALVIEAHAVLRAAIDWSGILEK